MTPRERFFKRITGQSTDRTPFFPDLSKWYEYHRNADEVPEKDYLPGELIPPEAPINQKAGIIPARYRNMNLLDIHRELDCGVPANFFIEQKPQSEIIDFARMIIEVMGEKLILNVGDIMPELGDIELIRKIRERI